MLLKCLILPQDDLLNIDNLYFEQMVGQTYLNKLRLNKTIPLILKVRKVAKIRNRYNQVPHLTMGTTRGGDKNTTKHHKQEPRGHPLPEGDHKAAMDRRGSMTNTRHK